MKKILYILVAVSLLSVGCTKEVLVSRDHDINAEVVEMQTKLEMKTLYCNLNESNVVDLQKLSEYLTANDADVAMFVAKRLSTLESVVSTATHFVLRRYKDRNILFVQEEKDEREAL